MSLPASPCSRPRARPLRLLPAVALSLAGCAAAGPLRSGGHGASVTVDVRNDRNARPGALRLASADYAIDGKPVLKLRTEGAGDVPDVASWTGALAPGEHVLAATLSYPPRSDPGQDLEFRIHEEYRFRSARGDVVRIRVEEALRDVGLTASLDQRLGLRIQRY